MKTWTDQDLQRLDVEFAKADVAFHARPLHAAMAILGTQFVLGAGNTKVQEIADDYRRLFPEADSTWPGVGIGLAASVDSVRKIVVPVVFGNGGGPISLAKALNFPSHNEFASWCRGDPNIAIRCAFAMADAYDFAYGVDDLGDAAPGSELRKLALSNLEDVANIMTSTFSVDSVVQPICLTAELAMKACLVNKGFDADKLKFKPFGHDLVVIAAKMAELSPHRDDAIVKDVIDHLPGYVESRYKSAGLSRLEAVNLALGAQFIAASSVRRLSARDLASDVEQTNGPRPDFFL